MGKGMRLMKKIIELKVEQFSYYSTRIISHLAKPWSHGPAFKLT